MTRERPILFSGPMVRAILAGRKTQTRRIVKPQFTRLWGHGVCRGDDVFSIHVDIHDDNGAWKWLRCPYGKPGDRLRISEEITVKAIDGERYSVLYHADGTLIERFGTPELIGRIRSYKTGHLRGVHLPPAYARPERPEIASVRAERLQDISEADAIAEGCCPRGWDVTDWRHPAGNCSSPIAVANFASLWQESNGPDSWQDNWVWAIEWHPIEKN